MVLLAIETAHTEWQCKIISGICPLLYPYPLRPCLMHGHYAALGNDLAAGGLPSCTVQAAVWLRTRPKMALLEIETAHTEWPCKMISEICPLCYSHALRPCSMRDHYAALGNDLAAGGTSFMYRASCCSVANRAENGPPDDRDRPHGMAMQDHFRGLSTLFTLSITSMPHAWSLCSPGKRPGGRRLFLHVPCKLLFGGVHGRKWPSLR